MHPTIEDGLCNQKEVNQRKLKKKPFSSNLLDLCKTRAKESSPDMFNFYVVLAGHDKVSDATRATTCRRKFKAPSEQAKKYNK